MHQLQRWLDEYCATGVHRTGSDADERTLAWLGAELRRLGGRVELRRFGFDGYRGASYVTIDGDEVASDLLYYEGVGDVSTDRPLTAALDPLDGHATSASLADAIGRARDARAPALAIATTNPTGELQLPNRAPRLASGIPTVLVPGRHEAALAEGRVHVDVTAHTEPAESANLIAHIGDTRSARPIVLATPLTGWFECAAERGTGVAVLLGLIERVTEHRPVVVVGSPGHELLPHIGLAAYLERFDLDPALVVHLGANVALCDLDRTGARRLAPGATDPTALPVAWRGAFGRIPDTVAPDVAAALANADLHPIWCPDRWLGEGALWAAATDAPLLSFVGSGPYFHTPADVVGTTTDATALVVVRDAIADAVDAALGT